jgi:hypothetical protein
VFLVKRKRCNYLFPSFLWKTCPRWWIYPFACLRVAYLPRDIMNLSSSLLRGNIFIPAYMNSFTRLSAFHEWFFFTMMTTNVYPRLHALAVDVRRISHHCRLTIRKKYTKKSKQKPSRC